MAKMDGRMSIEENFIFDWLDRHMDLDCQCDAVFPQQNSQLYLPAGSPLFFQYWPERPWPEYGEKPLHFQSVEIINDRPYLLQLEKVEYQNVPYIKTFTIRSLPLENLGGVVVDDYVIYLENNEYRWVGRLSQNHEYVISYEITLVRLFDRQLQ